MADVIPFFGVHNILSKSNASNASNTLNPTTQNLGQLVFS